MNNSSFPTACSLSATGGRFSCFPLFQFTGKGGVATPPSGGIQPPSLRTPGAAHAFPEKHDRRISSLVFRISHKKPVIHFIAVSFNRGEPQCRESPAIGLKRRSRLNFYEIQDLPLFLRRFWALKRERSELHDR